MMPKLLAAMIATVGGCMFASLLGPGVVVRPVPRQTESDTTSPPLVAPAKEGPAQHTIVIDEEAPHPPTGGFVFAGCWVDVVRGLPDANGDAHWVSVLEQVRVRDTQYDDPKAFRYTVEVTPEQAAQFAEAKKKGGRFRVVLLPFTDAFPAP